MNPAGRLVLLVQLPIPPPSPSPEPVRGNVPLAAAYLKLFARRLGLEDHFRIELLPPALCNTLGDQGLVEEILGRQPWMVGFSCYLWNIQRTLWIVQSLKQRQPWLKVLLGGPEITPDNAWPLDPDVIDYAVVGEGEPTFAALLDSLQAGSAAGRPDAGALDRFRRLVSVDAESAGQPGCRLVAILGRHSQRAGRADHVPGNGPRLPVPVPLLFLSEGAWPVAAALARADRGQPASCGGSARLPRSFCSIRR